MNYKGLILSYFLLAGNFVGNAQDLPAQTIALNQLKDHIANPSDKIKVINFWATWCAPCIKELPLFEALGSRRDDVDIILVSMDMDLDPDPEKVYRFVRRKNLQSVVWILKEEKAPNTWIDQIDERWSGALPATLIISTTGQRIFIEKELHDGDLDKLIQQL